MDPVCSPVHRSPKSCGIDKGLEEQYWMAETLLPVTKEPSFTQREHTGTQIRNMPVGQNTKTAVVHHQLQAIILMPEAPSDPAIPGCALQCLSGKGDKSHPFTTPGSYVPKSLSYFRERAQVVVRFHQALILLFFGWPHRPENNFLHVHNAHLRFSQP